MLQLSHQSDLAEDPLAVCFILKNVLHSLDRNFLASAFARGEGDLAIRACTEEFFTGIVIADLPVLKLIEAKITSTSSPRYGRLCSGLRLGLRLRRLTTYLVIVFYHSQIFVSMNDLIEMLFLN